jgi:hypothetical protein
MLKNIFKTTTPFFRIFEKKNSKSGSLIFSLKMQFYLLVYCHMSTTEIVSRVKTILLHFLKDHDMNKSEKKI